MITKEVINSISLDKFRSISNIDQHEFHQSPGSQHYKLLAYLSTLFNNGIIIDIGTHRGASATALSYNPTNTIYTFDIENRISDDFSSPKSIQNIVFNYTNIFSHDVRGSWKDRILSSNMIFLDIDPHDGVLEYEFYEWLKEQNYQGLLVLDDIWYFKGMRNNFWYKIEGKYKEDITNLGHWSGTGVVQFNKKYEFEVIKNTTNPTKPTLVTAYYDLTKMPDASQSIKDRPKEHYLDNAYSTLFLEYDMVIYCEEDNLEKIKSIRPERLHNRTKFIVNKFDDFEIEGHNFAYYRQKVKENRENHPYVFDSRNTPSYYLFCISRYLMIQETIKTNPFNSDHFVWINICIERMGYKNLIYMEETLTNIRDKFSTCYIDYVNEPLVRNTAEYFKFGRCGMCSGFFTGNGYYFNEFCKGLLKKFVEFVNLGYGHADEQLFSAVYFDNREIFDFYYGDYQQMVCNYKYIRENPDITIRALIRKSVEEGDAKVCIDACRFMWISFMSGTVQLNNDLYREFMNYYVRGLVNLSKGELSELNLHEIKSLYQEIKKRNISL